jgi:hypothetical protein
MKMHRLSGSIRQSCLGLLALLAGMAPLAGAQTVQVSAGGQNVSIQDYRNHLQDLQALVGKCRQQRTPEACDPSQVGTDDIVMWPAGSAATPRAIHYDWLRELLLHARENQEPENANRAPVIKRPPVTLDELLAKAQQRLQSDWQEAGGTAQPAQDFGADRRSLDSILARPEYQGTSEISAQDRFWEWVDNRINDLFEKLIGIGARAPWIGYVLEALLVGGLATALIWALLRLERRYRMRLTPEVERASIAPSAREWQLWFRDAQAMAAQGRWREAIHFLYWASISRLESMRLWPADSARTPREYLRLLAGTDPRRTNLTALTRSFERTWYGGRDAGSADFQAASQMAAALGVE